MNLYKISQTVRRGWDTFSDAIVAADSPEDAALIHPNSRSEFFKGWPIANTPPEWEDKPEGGWAYDPSEVRVNFIGIAVEGTKEGVICASFHAG